MPRPKHLVKLSRDERERLLGIVRSGNSSAHIQRRARILLKADTSKGGPASDDATLAAAVEVSRPTVERVRRAFATAGLDAALKRKAWSGPSRHKLDGAQEARLAALACSPAPQGAERWTLTLLADKLVELKVVDSIAPDTVRLALKKTNSSRG